MPQPSTPESIPRRHDLDALRAVAMTAGIVLHGLLSFNPRTAGYWPVVDTQQNLAADVLMASIHGFRMPLFFLISGFFTAMLWRKRGLSALIRHRCKRILLPLVVCLFTIIPLTWAAIIGASNQGSVSNQPTAQKDESGLYAAIRRGDADAVQQAIKGGQPIDQEREKITPLGLAAIFGHADLVEILLDSNADIGQSFGDQSATALHAAAFMGQDECVRILLDRGADRLGRDGNYSTAADAARAPLDLAKWIAGLIQLDIQDEEIIAGRKRALSMLEPSTKGGVPDKENQATDRNNRPKATSGFQAFYGKVIALGQAPIFHHLWFLWFLCWLVAGFAIYAALMNTLDWNTWPKRLVASPICYLWLIPITYLLQRTMLFPTFGPDTSSGYVPFPHLLVYYGVFFFFGAIYFDVDDDQGRLGQWWWLTIPLALLVVLPIGYETTSGGLGIGDQVPKQHYQLISHVTQAVYVWLMTCGSIGVFRAFFSSENRIMRYLSDSSYWLYLAHLPLIIVLQRLIAPWPLPAFAKLVLLSAVCTLLLLFSYEYLVRYTFVGTMLNGKKERPTA